MTLRQLLRAIPALSAAYAVVLQSILLAASLPSIGAAGPFDRAVCSSLHAAANGLPGPAEGGHDCTASCLAAGCGSPGAASTRVAGIVVYSAPISRTASFAADISPASHAVGAGPYHPRAPPLR